ncbi:MAG: hypothetical protein DMF50_08290 [Acidobacteria bacterium]|nr:MAG: hypothetical protein DMF50_08290 [Acidobacteriota bacterium]
MVHLFRRRDERDGPPIEGGNDSVLASHILAKFLKRLRAMPKAHLLDLGRLSGPNIEFFARAGCKVQVEDLLHFAAPGETAAPMPPASTDAGPAALVAPEPVAPEPARPAPPPPSKQPISPAPAAPPGTSARPGQRPSRRIVLPPRVFPKRAGGRQDPPSARGMTAATLAGAVPPGGARSAWRCGLPTTFAYPGETFDAVVAWDIFNYYDPESVHAVAAETRRVLKPGGLVLCYFHARRPHDPDVPPRYRILDEKRVACDAGQGPLLQRQVYQNRDIEKMFVGLRIVELYFLKNSVRELLMEKKPAMAPGARPLVRPAEPKPRFTIE